MVEIENKGKLRKISMERIHISKQDRRQKDKYNQ
jgi:hypothetical protein